MELIAEIWRDSGLYQVTIGQVIMLGICLLLLYLGIVKKFEPLLLVTIGFGGLLSNIPGAEIATGDDFSLKDAAAIGIIGGADGPTAIYVSSQLAPHLLGAIAVAAYSYMALVPMIQPPIMRALTTKEERKITMVQLRNVTKTEKVLFRRQDA